MATPTKFAAAESKKRKQALSFDKLKKLFDTEPANYQTAWNELKHYIIQFSEPTRQTVTSVNFSQ